MARGRVASDLGAGALASVLAAALRPSHLTAS